MLNAHSPACPSCGALITKVIHTRFDEAAGHIVRRRHCRFCDARFYTGQAVEQIVDVQWASRHPIIMKFHEQPFRRFPAAQGRSANRAPSPDHPDRHQN